MALLLLVVTGSALALDNGLSRTPAMGWNSYNAFSCNAVEQNYRDAALALVDLGLKDLGYDYLGVDCGWQGRNRTADGTFTWDTSIMPNGVPALGEFVHSLGLKFGLYGYYACDFVGGTALYLGSLNFEVQDAKTFALWGADYLKYDNCYSTAPNEFLNYFPSISVCSVFAALKPELIDHFVTMRDALADLDRPILYSACEWGVQDPARWPGAEVANSWRISNDIGPSWVNVFRIINQVVPITQFAEPGAWNDLDLLEVGNSPFTEAEQLTHFAFWAAVKSPLLISTDLTKATEATLEILRNERIIGLNQDPLGKSIDFKRRYANDSDVWAGPLADGSTVALIINWKDSARDLTFNLADIGLSSADAVDLVTGNSLGHLDTTYTARAAAHGSFVLKLTNQIASSPPSFTYYEAAAASSVLEGGAVRRTINSSTTVVGSLGDGASVTLTGISVAEGGKKLLAIEYTNGDYTFGNDGCPNCRNAYVSVNDGEDVWAQMPIAAQNWDVVFKGFLLEVEGFRVGGNNTVRVRNEDAGAPEIYRIGVSD
ncbi:glycoside hydrolase family 27 protein [Hymenopellis radicata]|nr:glycoside hydrolase family 27 protein [Hymenopellis radicata]